MEAEAKVFLHLGFPTKAEVSSYNNLSLCCTLAALRETVRVLGNLERTRPQHAGARRGQEIDTPGSQKLQAFRPDVPAYVCACV